MSAGLPAISSRQLRLLSDPTPDVGALNDELKLHEFSEQIRRFILTLRDSIEDFDINHETISGRLFMTVPSQFRMLVLGSRETQHDANLCHHFFAGAGFEGVCELDLSAKGVQEAIIELFNPPLGEFSCVVAVFLNLSEPDEFATLKSILLSWRTRVQPSKGRLLLIHTNPTFEENHLPNVIVHRFVSPSLEFCYGHHAHWLKSIQSQTIGPRLRKLVTPTLDQLEVASVSTTFEAFGEFPPLEINSKSLLGSKAYTLKLILTLDRPLNDQNLVDRGSRDGSGAASVISIRDDALCFLGDKAQTSTRVPSARWFAVTLVVLPFGSVLYQDEEVLISSTRSPSLEGKYYLRGSPRVRYKYVCFHRGVFGDIPTWIHEHFHLLRLPNIRRAQLLARAGAINQELKIATDTSELQVLHLLFSKCGEFAGLNMEDKVSSRSSAAVALRIGAALHSLWRFLSILGRQSPRSLLRHLILLQPFLFIEQFLMTCIAAPYRPVCRTVSASVRSGDWKHLMPAAQILYASCLQETLFQNEPRSFSSTDFKSFQQGETLFALDSQQNESAPATSKVLSSPSGLVIIFDPATLRIDKLDLPGFSIDYSGRDEFEVPLEHAIERLRKCFLRPATLYLVWYLGISDPNSGDWIFLSPSQRLSLKALWQLFAFCTRSAGTLSIRYFTFTLWCDVTGNSSSCSTYSIAFEPPMGGFD